MKKIVAFSRLNKLNKEDRIDLLEGYKYFQAFHDCLYMYESLEDITNEDAVCVLDRNYTFVEFERDGTVKNRH